MSNGDLWPEQPVKPIPKQTELQKMLPEINPAQMKWLEAYIQKQVSDKVAEKVWQATGTSELRRV